VAEEIVAEWKHRGFDDVVSGKEAHKCGGARFQASGSGMSAGGEVGVESITKPKRELMEVGRGSWGEEGRFSRRESVSAEFKAEAI